MLPKRGPPSAWHAHSSGLAHPCPGHCPAPPDAHCGGWGDSYRKHQLKQNSGEGKSVLRGVGALAFAGGMVGSVKEVTVSWPEDSQCHRVSDGASPQGGVLGRAGKGRARGVHHSREGRTQPLLVPGVCHRGGRHPNMTVSAQRVSPQSTPGSPGPGSLPLLSQEKAQEHSQRPSLTQRLNDRLGREQVPTQRPSHCTIQYL